MLVKQSYKCNSVILILLATLAFGCSSDETEEQVQPSTASPEINSIIKGAGRLPSVPDSKEEELKKEQDTVQENGKTLVCDIVTKKKTRKFLEYINFQNNSDIYPGSLIQGRQLFENGSITSIGSFPMEKQKLTIQGLTLNQNSVNFEPTLSDFDNARNTILDSWDGQGQKEQYEFQQVTAHSKTQGLMDIGAKANWIGGNFSASFTDQSSSEKSVTYILFKQVYYTASVEAPAAPRSYFTSEIKKEDLNTKTGNGNPIGYITEVDYGRMLFAQIESDSSSEAVQSAMAARFPGSGGGNLNSAQESVISNSKFSITTAGGDSDGKLLQNFDDIVNFIESGFQFNPKNISVPVRYKVKYLSDNTTMAIGDETEYSTRECTNVTEREELKIRFDKFAIKYDCDNGVFTDAGEGEFFYSIFINGDLVRSISEDNARGASSGQDIVLDFSKTINPIARQGEKFTVGVFLEETDKVGSNNGNETLGNFSYEFTYPFDDDLGSQVRALVEDPNQCSADFHFSISRK